MSARGDAGPCHCIDGDRWRSCERRWTHEMVIVCRTPTRRASPTYLTASVRAEATRVCVETARQVRIRRQLPCLGLGSDSRHSRAYGGVEGSFSGDSHRGLRVRGSLLPCLSPFGLNASMQCAQPLTFKTL